MEIITAVDLQLPAAEPPICAQEKMVAEYVVVEIVVLITPELLGG